MSKGLVLPRKDKEGNYYISYSQIKSWNESKSFNLGVLGKLEYMLQYFMEHDFGDVGWAQFGTDVEDYITERKKGRTFDDREKGVLESIETLGVFQQEIKIDFDGFYLKGFIDDMTTDMAHIRDYKTCSLNSSKKYYKPKYKQLHIYAMWVLQETGKLPEICEVMMIERTGNCFRTPGRKNLNVGKEIWTHEIEVTEKSLEPIRENIIQTAQEISDCYKLYLDIGKAV